MSARVTPKSLAAARQSAQSAARDRQIRVAVDEVRDDCIKLRRLVHQFPELGWCEFQTTAHVIRALRSIDVDAAWGTELYGSAYRLGLPDEATLEQAFDAAVARVPDLNISSMAGGFTGVVASIHGSRRGPVRALRLDIDALPLHESQDPSHRPKVEGFASHHEGLMHACGHDGHVAIGVGVARVLGRLRDLISGEIRLIFQPAEEGTRGATAITEAGWLDRVDVLFALHIGAEAAVGTHTIVPGVTGLLATEKFDVSFRGRSAHFSERPHIGRNALDAASGVALLSHSIRGAPGSRGAVNVGRLEGGSARNIVPGTAMIELEIRSESDDELANLRRRLDSLIAGTSSALGIEAALDCVGRSPAASSDAALAALVREEALLMDLPVIDEMCFGASDDAAVMMRRVQERGGLATYMLIGSDGATEFHTEGFDFDEASMATAIELLVRALLRTDIPNE